jgi:hypothetical protein
MSNSEIIMVVRISVKMIQDIQALECFLEKTPLSPLGVNIHVCIWAMNADNMSDSKRMHSLG